MRTTHCPRCQQALEHPEPSACSVEYAPSQSMANGTVSVFFREVRIPHTCAPEAS